MNILEVSQLSKSFQGKQVLKGLDFVVPKGSIYGFVGKNGAGKTTTMKMILGLETVDQGVINVLGESVRFGETPTNRFTGYLPDVPVFYNYMTAKEYLMLCGEITKIPNNMLVKRVAEMLELVSLADKPMKIGGFSRGMKQRLGIAQALLNQPQLLICDEPTSALDPSGRHEFLSLLSSLKQETTILFSTHILSDVEAVCDRIGILDQGKIVVSSTINELKQSFDSKKIQISFQNQSEKAYFLSALPKNYHVEEGIAKISLTSDTPQVLAKTVFSLLTKLAIVPLSFEQREPSLEEIYLEVIQ